MRYTPCCNPVTGPKDLIVNGVNGFTDDNLLNAIDQVVKVPSSGCIDFASRFTWDKVAEQFKNALVPKALNQVTKTARDLISQYGDDAESIAMLRAAEHAANPIILSGKYGRKFLVWLLSYKMQNI